MGLFRRIFGKTDDEPKVQETKIQDEAVQQPPSEEATDEHEVTQHNDDSETVVNQDKLDTIEVNTTEVSELDDDSDADEQEETPVEAGEFVDATTKPVATIATGPLPQGRGIIDGATRPLAPDQMYPSQEDILNSDKLTFGLSSHVGRVRSNNQDAAQSLFVTSESSEDHPDFGVFVVADGMGGHHDGEKASAITARTVTSYIMKKIYLPMFSGDEDAERIPISEALVDSIKNANQKVIENVPEGGTTATVVAIIGDLAHFAHVGDSRAYLITKKEMEQVTRDHSLVQRLIELGQLTPEEAEEHPQKNVLYRALGQNETLEVDSKALRLPAGSRLLLCSDGLWGMVPQSDIYEVVMNTNDPQQACEKLVALANAKGGTDNITAIIIQVSSS